MRGRRRCQVRGLRQSLKSQRFLKPADQIEILNRDARGTFDEVVEGREDDHSVLNSTSREIAVVGVGGRFG